MIFGTYSAPPGWSGEHQLRIPPMANLDAARCWLSLLRAVVNLRAVVDVEDVDNAAVLVDPVDDAIGASPGTMTASERPEQRLADPLRVDR